MKKLWVILLAMCFLFSLAACGGNEEKGIIFVNGLDWDLTGVYIVPTDTDDWGDKKFGPMESGLDVYVYGEQSFGIRELVVDIMATDEDGERYEVYGVPIKDGDTVMMQLDESSSFAVYVNETEKYAGEWIYEDDEPDVPDEPDEPEPITAERYTGVWKYEDYFAFVLLYEDGTFAEIDEETGELRVQGTFELLEDGYLELFGDDGENYGWFDNIFFEDEGGNPLPRHKLRSHYCEMMEYYCGFDSPAYQEILAGVAVAETPVPYFEKMGWEMNYDFGEGGTYMSDGGRVSAQEGTYYDTFPVTVSLELDSFNDTQDGYVEIEFTQTVWMDKNDYPEFMFYNKFNIGTSQKLLDYYTGYELPDTDTFGDTSRGENYHYYEYESQGRTICIDYNYDTNWERLADSSYILTMQRFIRMPADYDGIVFAYLEGYPDYESYMAAQSDLGDEMRVTEDHRLADAILCRVNTVD